MSFKAKKVANKWIDGNESRLTEMSDAIWEYAELGYVEFKCPTDSRSRGEWREYPQRS